MHGMPCVHMTGKSCQAKHHDICTAPGPPIGCSLTRQRQQPQRHTHWHKLPAIAKYEAAITTEAIPPRLTLKYPKDAFSELISRVPGTHSKVPSFKSSTQTATGVSPLLCKR